MQNHQTWLFLAHILLKLLCHLKSCHHTTPRHSHGGMLCVSMKCVCWGHNSLSCKPGFGWHSPSENPAPMLSGRKGEGRERSAQALEPCPCQEGHRNLGLVEVSRLMPVLLILCRIINREFALKSLSVDLSGDIACVQAGELWEGAQLL